MKKDQFRVLDGILKNSLHKCDSNEQYTPYVCTICTKQVCRSSIDLKGYGTDPSIK